MVLYRCKDKEGGIRRKLFTQYFADEQMKRIVANELDEQYLKLGANINVLEFYL